MKPGAEKPEFTTIIIPDIFGGAQQTRNLPNNVDPNRAFPEAGKSLDETIRPGESQPRDARGRVIPQALQQLIRIREQFKPERVLQLHGISYAPTNLGQPGITMDPRMGLQVADARLTQDMANVARTEGARVPGNRSSTISPELIYPTEAPKVQKGVTAGTCFSEATSKAPAANVVLIETLNKPLPQDRHPAAERKRAETDVNAFVKSIVRVFLNKY